METIVKALVAENSLNRDSVARADRKVGSKEDEIGMAPGQFHEGELMAYLHGEPRSSFRRGIGWLMEYREELKDFAQAIGVLTNVMGELDRPDFQDLIDVALSASPAQRLRVAAYVRNSEKGEMAEIEQDIANEWVDERARWHLPIFIAAPLAAATGLRSGSTIESVGTAAQEMFQVLDIQLQVTVHIRLFPNRWTLGDRGLSDAAFCADDRDHRGTASGASYIINGRI